MPALSCFALVLVDLLSRTRRVSETLLQRITPPVLRALQRPDCPDYQSAAMMVLTQLSSRATLSADFLLAVVPAMFQDASSARSANSALLCAVALFQQHDAEVLLPRPALDSIAAVRCGTSA